MLDNKCKVEGCKRIATDTVRYKMPQQSESGLTHYAPGVLPDFADVPVCDGHGFNIAMVTPIDYEYEIIPR